MKISLKILVTSMVAVACNSVLAQTEGTGKLIPADQWKPVQPGGTSSRGFITTPPIAPLVLDEVPSVGIVRKNQVGQIPISDFPAQRTKPIAFNPKVLERGSGVIESLSISQAFVSVQPALVSDDQVKEWLRNNPTASDREIRAAMDQHGVTVGQMARATGLDFNSVQQRYDRAIDSTIKKNCVFKWERQDSGSPVSITSAPQDQIRSSVNAPDVKALGAGATINEGAYSQETSDGRFYNYGPVQWRSVEFCHY